MLPYRIIVLGSVLFFIINNTYSQSFNNLKFRTYGLREGLPFNRISSVGKDSSGFIWVSTEEGVCRFDGVRFEYFKSGDETPYKLRSSGQYFIASDNHKRLWIGGDNGLAWYNAAQNRFEYPQFKGYSDSIPIQRFWFDKKNTLWAFSNDQLIAINTNTLNLDTMPAHFRGCFDVYGDSKGRIWATGVGGKLMQYNIQTKQMTVQKVPFESLDIFEDSKGWIWFTGGKLFGLNPQTQVIEGFLPEKMPDSEIFMTRHLSTFPHFTADSILWVTTLNHGIVLFNLNTHKFLERFIKKDPLLLSSLPGNRLRYLFDDGKNLWIAPFSGGLTKLDMQDQDFGSVRLTFQEEQNAPEITTICEDTRNKDIWWAGTRGGGLIQYNYLDKKVLNRYLTPNAATYQSTAEVNDICIDNTGKLWIATEGGVFYIENNVLKPKNIPVTAKSIRRMSKGLNDNIWLLNQENLLLLNTKTGIIKPFPIPDFLKNKLQLPTLIDAEEDKNGIVWLATFKGLIQFTPQTANWQLLSPFEQDAHDTNSWTTDIEKDQNGNLWMSTFEGLIYYNIDKKAFKLYTEKEGIPPVIITQVFTDAAGGVWAFTQYGVYFKENISPIFKKMEINNGFSNDDYKGVVRNIHRLNGKFFFIKEGMNLSFDPLKVNQNTGLATPLIRYFMVKNQAYPFDNQQVTNTYLTLPYHQNFVLFDYTAINYTQSESLHFKYILEGFGKDTTFANTIRTANYTNLPSGKYIFKLWAANSAGLWNSTPSVFHLKINAPWWEAWWFRLLAFLSFILLVRWWYKSQAQKAKARADEKEREAMFKQREAELRHEVSEVKLAALSAQMNPHFVFNCLNSINNYIVMNDADNASHYLGMFSKLIRRVLDSSRTEYVNLETELETLRLYIELESMRFGKKFDYDINITEGVDVAAIVVPPLLIQPYIENAIWHGMMHKKDGHGRLNVHVGLEDTGKKEEKVVITIEDNGVGRNQAALIKSKAANQHKSHGMNVNHERLGVINELYHLDAHVRIHDLMAENGESLGTKVVLRMNTQLN